MLTGAERVEVFALLEWVRCGGRSSATVADMPRRRSRPPPQPLHAAASWPLFAALRGRRPSKIATLSTSLGGNTRRGPTLRHCLEKPEHRILSLCDF